jgi:hypothetical protein
MKILLVPALAAAAIAPGIGPNIDVSNSPYAQSEVRVAIDPTDDSTLVAGSNSNGERAMLVYGSQDAGATWTLDPLTPTGESPGSVCAAHPAVGVDLTGRQYYLFVLVDPCGGESSTLTLMTRASATGTWAEATGAIVPSELGESFYVAWFRYGATGEEGLLIASTDDGGRTWSKPIRVNDTRGEDGYPSVAVAADGDVYVAWHEFSTGLLKIDRSTDGGTTFHRDVRVRVKVRDDRGSKRDRHPRAGASLCSCRPDRNYGQQPRLPHLFRHGRERVTGHLRLDLRPSS